MATTAEEITTPVADALKVFETALDGLVATVEAGGLDHFDDAELMAFLQGFERARNRMALVDHRTVADAERRRLPEALCQSSMRQVLVAALRLSKAEASRRVRAADAVGPRTSMTGESLAPTRPRLAAAVRDGVVSAEHVAVVERALGHVDRRGFDPADVDAGEALLVEQARSFTPETLRLLAAQVVDAIDPDGTLPREELNADRRHFGLRPTRDGGFVGEFRLTGSAGAKLKALLEPLARPRVSSAALIQSSDPSQACPNAAASLAGDVDTRTYGQRMHDALEECCDRLLAAGDQPEAGGVPTTVIVTITLEDLLARSGFGRTADGTLLPAAEVLRLAGQADVVPTVLTRAGAVLDLGRSRRIATPTQTLALAARDGGCSFPGCDRGPQGCERHHIVAWVDGGRTDLDNLTLLCRYHHHFFAERGWSCRIDTDRVPRWIPPRWIDPEQTPLVNTRVTAALIARRQARPPGLGSVRAPEHHPPQTPFDDGLEADQDTLTPTAV